MGETDGGIRSRSRNLFDIKLARVYLAASQTVGENEMLDGIRRDAFDSQELAAVGIERDRIGPRDHLIGRGHFAWSFGAARLEGASRVGDDKRGSNEQVEFRDAVMQAVAMVVLAVPDAAHQLLHRDGDRRCLMVFDDRVDDEAVGLDDIAW